MHKSSGAITVARFWILTKPRLYLLASPGLWTLPPHCDLVLSLVSIRAIPNFNNLVVKFDSKLTFEGQVHFSCLSKNLNFEVSEACHCGHLALRYFVAITYLFSQSFKCCSPVWGSAAECHIQLLESQVFGCQACSDHGFLSLCHRRHVAWLCLLNSNHCLFSELPSASTRVQHTRAAAASHPL